MPMVGTGTTISFASGFMAEILSIQPPNPTREAIDTTHMGTTPAKTFVPGDLADWGELRAEIAFIPETAVPINAATGSIVITFPDSGATTWTFSGFMIGFEPSVPLEERATANVVIKVTGAITVG